MKTETATQTPEDVLNELRSLVTEAERILGQQPQASWEYDVTLESLRERLEAAQQRVAAVYQEAKQKVVAGAKFTDQSIRENPYQAIAIALGIGLLAGALLGRRSNAKPLSE